MSQPGLHEILSPEKEGRKLGSLKVTWGKGPMDQYPMIYMLGEEVLPERRLKKKVIDLS